MKLELNIKTVDEKNKAVSTLIVDLLKKRGIPAGQAVKIWQTNRPEYIVRKCFMYDFYVEKTGNVISSMKWLQSAIRNDYNESDTFLNWYKAKKQYILENGNNDLKQLVSL